ncbi:MAG: M28 family peptidase [Planctomycetes bacterium]|nr:M28 family peptidase [Planctomycetota bacterium]
MKPLAALALASCLLAACARKAELTDAELVELRAAAAAAPQIQPAAHRGPPVAPGPGGTARFARLVHEAFSQDQALALARFADGFYREPANEGFEATLAEVERVLRGAGFGAHEGFALEVFETPAARPAWTPRSARLELVRDGQVVVLHAFDAPGDRDRTMLPAGAPSADLEARIAVRLEDCGPGSALLLEPGLRTDLLRRAAQQGAVLAIAGELASYNVDPTGRDRHRDAIGYRSVRGEVPLPVVQVSPRSFEALRAAARERSSRVRFTARVETAERPLRTLVATVLGARDPGLAVPILAHVQEPGACDNASGVGAVAECARLLAGLVQDGRLPRPRRSVAFVFGHEMAQSQVWLERSGRRALAAIAADMLGESRAETGAEPLLERAPDPGALKPLPPDFHTAWGAARVSPSDLRADGVALIVRQALSDVGLAAGGWETAEHPFEGGSDHVVFLEAGVPAALVWHFPDWAYHTSADRMEHVDAGEMRRSGAAVLSAALALADAAPEDLDRHLRSAKLEVDLRVATASSAGDEDLARRWHEHGDGVRQWLRELCLGERARLSPGAGSRSGGGS